MSDYIVTDTELSETADAIRAKTGDANLIEWKSGTGFANAVAAISGGGLSDSDAILAAKVQSGATVVATKNGVSIAPTLYALGSSQSIEIAVFVIQASLFDSVNAWTVTASTQTQQKTTTIIIPSSGYYEVSLNLLYLFNLGDPCTAVTGGWSKEGWGHWDQTNKFLNVDGTIESGYMRLYGQDGKTIGLGTQAPIDVTNFNTLTVTGNILSNISNISLQYAGVCNSKGGYTAAIVMWSLNSIGTFSNIIDISGVTGDVYFYFAVGASYMCKAEILTMKLE